MKHPGTRDLFGYWNDLRGERAAPERGEIDPVAIRSVIADTFMLDIDPEGRFPIRLAGTRFSGLFTAEQKGRSFLDLWRDEERHNLTGVLLAVADGATPIVAGAVATGGGRDECALELLFLPLRHHGRTHARLLGSIKATTKTNWLGLLPAGPLSLRALRVVDLDEREAQRATLRAPEPVLPVEARPSVPQRPALTLIQGGLAG
jgi:hypothetical protein